MLKGIFSSRDEALTKILGNAMILCRSLYEQSANANISADYSLSKCVGVWSYVKDWRRIADRVIDFCTCWSFGMAEERHLKLIRCDGSSTYKPSVLSIDRMI
jgi:hypothetical protein